jgi:hypothetical protein
MAHKWANMAEKPPAPYLAGREGKSRRYMYIPYESGENRIKPIGHRNAVEKLNAINNILDVVRKRHQRGAEAKTRREQLKRAWKFNRKPVAGFSPAQLAVQRAFAERAHAVKAGQVPKLKQGDKLMAERITPKRRELTFREPRTVFGFRANKIISKGVSKRRKQKKQAKKGASSSRPKEKEKEKEKESEGEEDILLAGPGETYEDLQGNVAMENLSGRKRRR